MGISLTCLWLLSSASTVIVFAVFVGKSVPSHAALGASPTIVEVVISGASAKYWRHRHRYDRVKSVRGMASATAPHRWPSPQPTTLSPPAPTLQSATTMAAAVALPFAPPFDKKFFDNELYDKSHAMASRPTVLS
jgi:hypothetical protein